MTPIYIRTVRSRAKGLEYLVKNIPHAYIVHDRTRNAMDTFRLAMEAAGDEAAVHMDDDVIVCPNFVERMEAEIAQKPESPIQFFSRRKDDLTLGSRWSYSFWYTLCYYIPKGVGLEVNAAMAEWCAKFPQHSRGGLDMLTSDVLAKKRMKHWIVCPNLVNHRREVSSIDPRRSKCRQSLTFELPGA